MPICKQCSKCKRIGGYTPKADSDRCAKCLIKKAIKKTTEEAVEALENQESE